MVVFQHRHFFYETGSFDVIMLSRLVYNFKINSQ